LYQIANENEIEMDSIISDNKEYIFRWSCKNGHLKVAHWLYQIKPDIDIFAKNDWAFRECCCDSRLELVEWLQSLFPEKYSFQRENGRINYQVMKAKRTIQNTITMEKEQIVKCAICDENLSDVQTSCKHLFCEDCITTWLETKSSCPYCRQEINYDNLCKIYFKV
jgi:hypothetical protein